jgi:hypothetical protein
MTTAAANLWHTPTKAGPSRLGVSHPGLRDPHSDPQGTPSASDTASTYSASVHSASASVHSALSGRNLSNLFVRRGSLTRACAPGRARARGIQTGTRSK